MVAVNRGDGIWLLLLLSAQIIGTGVGIAAGYAAFGLGSRSAADPHKVAGAWQVSKEEIDSLNAGCTLQVETRVALGVVPDQAVVRVETKLL